MRLPWLIVCPDEIGLVNSKSESIRNRPKTIDRPGLPPRLPRCKLLNLLQEGGTPERIRTSDLLLRRQTLYPAELRAHMRIIPPFQLHLTLPWVRDLTGQSFLIFRLW